MNLILHGTTPGMNYVLLSKQTLAGLNWSNVGAMTGAANQDWTAVSVPVGAQSSCFFQAQSAAGQTTSTILWLECLTVSNNVVNGLIHNSSPLVPYALSSMQSLLWPAWNAEATFYGSGFTNFTAFSVPRLGRNMLFLRARSNFAPRIIGAGVSHNVVIRRDGTVWAWGANGNGELGNGRWTNTNTPVRVTGLSNIVALVAPPDNSFTLALDAGGKVWSWGANGSGQLGRGDELYADENTAVLVPGLSNIVAIAGGVGDAVALKSDGTVWAWGDNSIGQLGDNYAENSRDYAAPVPGLTNAIGIATGGYHDFALCADGMVWGWGYNEGGELGLGNADDQPVPVLVSTLTNVVALSGGIFHSIALLSNGSVQAWGPNYLGEIGNISSLTPVTVSGLSNIIAIASGGFHNLFLDTNGTLFLWGNGSWYQMGNSSRTNVPMPFALTSVSNVTAIAGGETSSMISTADGSLYVWGSSGSGQQSLPFLVDLYANYSSDGSGLPDWWEIQYFGHLGLDPNADPAGDGWTLLQDFQNGLNPTNFYTPPTPSGLIATQNTNQAGITLTWNAASPSPVNYIIYRDDFDSSTLSYVFQQIGEVSSNVTTFVDNGAVAGGDANSVYEIEAVYPGGSSPPSAQAYINSTAPATLNYYLPMTAQMVRNSTGHWQLMFSGIPTNVVAVQLYIGLYGYEWDFEWGVDNNAADWFDNQELVDTIPVSSLTNGFFVIPDSITTNEIGDNQIGRLVGVQAVGPDERVGAMSFAGFLPYDAPGFVDGQQHLKQNLLFELRGATISHPIGLEEHNVWFDPFFTDIGIPADTNYVESSVFHYGLMFKAYNNFIVSYVEMDDLWPFTVNYDLHNRLYDPTYTGPSSFVWQTNLVTIPASAILGISDPYWISQGLGNLADVAAYTNSGNFYLQNGVNNLFGLAFATALVDTPGYHYYPYSGQPGGGSLTTLATGSSVSEANVSTFYSQTADPSLEIVGYYFAPVNTPGTALPGDNTPFEPYPLPMLTGFAATNQTGLMIASVGQPIVIGAWAKYSIQGSSPTKYAYLGQYFFTNAFMVNANGNITSTNTGIVSPYGEFFPTEPGPVALITMPDIDTGQQATGIVQIISLALDANHDGTIDTTFNGPDFVSANHPYRFWTDQNFDRLTTDADDGVQYDDDVSSTSSDANCPYTGVSTPDCNYLDGSGHRVIPCARDLQDFTRLWICGITSNLLAALPADSTVTLNWGDVGNPNPNNPTIDFFAAADADGGIGYLTNASTANSQVDSLYCPYIGRIGPGTNLQLNASRFVNNWAGNHFIWCGVAPGNGQLTLTITDGNGNTLAQTSTYIQLVDIKQMYERWTVGEDPNTAPTNTAQIATNDLPSGVIWPFQYANPGNANTPYILYVHGWNMETWEKDRFAESAFKRLYWRGYQGRFGVFRWPTGYGFTGSYWQALTDPRNFDNSEFTAWQSAVGLRNKLNDLNAQYPGHVYMLAHSMGNIVTGEALRLAGSNQLVNTYVASQAALPAHDYDATVTTPYLLQFTYTYPTEPLHTLLGNRNYGPDTPDIYGNWLTTNAAAVGRRISFYNQNDFALAAPRWGFDQITKPDNLFNGDYVYGGSPNDPAPWNHFGFATISGTNFFDIVNSVADRYRVMAYAAESRSTALGATPITTFDASVDLTSPDNHIWPTDTSGHDYGDHFWHSAEFRGDYWQEWNY